MCSRKFTKVVVAQANVRNLDEELDNHILDDGTIEVVGGAIEVNLICFVGGASDIDHLYLAYNHACNAIIDSRVVGILDHQ